MPDDEGHLFGRAKGSNDDQIALTFAIVIVGHDHEFARSKKPSTRQE